jgi:hypothetical protein
MTAPPIDWRRRLRPPFCAAVALVALLAGAVLAVAPAALAGSAWPPLHARCIGAMLLSLSVAMACARRALDAAALRMPLLALAAWSLSSAAVALLNSAAPWAWGLVAVGGAALLLSRIDSDPPAPAQHADKTWAAFALLALLAALLLLAASDLVIAQWPWRLAPAFVAQYAPLFLAWGVAAALLSRERRRYVRAPVLWGLMTWALSVLAVSLWHAAAFRWTQPLAWGWFAAFAALALLASHRLWPAWPRRLFRRALGLLSRDSGTTPPRQ